MEPDRKRLKSGGTTTSAAAPVAAEAVAVAAADAGDEASAYFCDVCKRVLDADEQRFSCAVAAATNGGDAGGGDDEPCPDGFDICAVCFVRAKPVRHEHPLCEVMTGITPPKIHILLRAPGISDVLVAPYTAAVRSAQADALCTANNVRHVLSLMDLDGSELLSKSVPVSAQRVTRSMANMCVLL